MDTSKTGTGRRRLTSKQRQRLLAKFHQSQLAQREFANQHAIGMSTLSKWLRVEVKPKPPRVKFQEVMMPNTPLRFAVEVVSPQGWIVRLHDGSDVQSLSSLLQALPC